MPKYRKALPQLGGDAIFLTDGGLAVLGGCCGTDHRHVSAICLACVAAG